MARLRSYSYWWFMGVVPACWEGGGGDWSSRLKLDWQSGRVCTTCTELHEAQPRIMKMKGLARSFVLYPGIDAELEQKVRASPECQSSKKLPIQ